MKPNFLFFPYIEKPSSGLKGLKSSQSSKYSSSSKKKTREQIQETGEEGEHKRLPSFSVIDKYRKSTKIPGVYVNLGRSKL